MGSALHGLLAVPPIPVGDHVKRSLGGLALNLDTIWTTLIACVAVLWLGFYVRARVTASTPNKVQLFWEVLIGWVSDQVEAGLGKRYRHVVPLAVTIFVLVLACNWVEIFPGLYHNTDYLPSPSADVNLTYALGATVFVLTNAESIRAKGLTGYIKSFFVKPRWLAPIRALEELMKPVTLSLRLFGNLFSGGIMIALLLAIPIYFFPATIFFSVVWKLFDMFIGGIQAFIFALLTILYYQFAVAQEAH
ncbi:MAG TPA: F0F1 ATP synthase subunit A [Acidimicrobiales bacterium]|nr:F0F1 ATP synthase subunit A [Acidimicrobiales bacterium]